MKLSVRWRAREHYLHRYPLCRQDVLMPSVSIGSIFLKDFIDLFEIHCINFSRLGMTRRLEDRSVCANVLVVSVKCTCGEYPLASVGVIKVHTGI